MFCASFFLHIHKYIVRVLLDFLSLSLFVSLSYKLTSQGKLKQISWSRARAHSFPLSLQIISLSKHGCAQVAAWAQLTLIVFYRRRRSLLVTQMAVAVGALAKNYNHN